jgi:TonB family protein
MTSCRTFSPYGAWELKRTYQRNLLLANLCVIALVLTAVGIPSILVKPPDIVALSDGEEGTDTVLIVATLDDTPVIIHDGRGRPRVQTPEELVARILVPIDDSLISDNDIPVVVSQDELEDFYLGGLVDDGGGGSDEGSGSGRNTVFLPETPGIDDYVPVDIDPKMVAEVRPDYPRHARQAGLEGDVWVAVLIDFDGTVSDARVKVSSGVASFDRAALDAAWKSRFKPAIRAGKPVLVWATYKVEFRLND